MEFVTYIYLCKDHDFAGVFVAKYNSFFATAKKSVARKFLELHSLSSNLKLEKNKNAKKLYVLKKTPVTWYISLCRSDVHDV